MIIPDQDPKEELILLAIDCYACNFGFTAAGICVNDVVNEAVIGIEHHKDDKRHTIFDFWSPSVEKPDLVAGVLRSIWDIHLFIRPQYKEVSK